MIEIVASSLTNLISFVLASEKTLKYPLVIFSPRSLRERDTQNENYSRMVWKESLLGRHGEYVANNNGEQEPPCNFSAKIKTKKEPWL
eukprot:snap_masked-scaffold_13-processed-gene-2.31-mRNA-1 protein AED:1.00 eAED:1.00 QI:0/0/0/0/1/1/3/0/87